MKTKRLLIVEDDPAISQMLSKILGLDGYDTTVVAQGHRALGVLRGAAFDAVILDVMLPGTDGIQILRGIRSDPATSALPVIMLTARTDDATTWAGWQAGC